MGIESIPFVQSTSVVPHHDVAHRPNLGPSETILSGVSPQCIQQGLAFLQCEAFDLSIAATPQQQGFFAGLRLSGHQGMNGTDRLCRVGVVGKSQSQLTGTVSTGIVYATQMLNALLEFIGQAVVGHVHVGKVGVSTRWGHFLAEQARAFRRKFVVGHVRMPNSFTIPKCSDRYTANFHVRNHGNFWRQFVMRLAHAVADGGSFVQRTKMLGKGDLLFKAYMRLISEPENQVRLPSLSDGVELVRTQGL